MKIYFGVENLEDYKKRIYSFIEDLVKDNRKVNCNILIVGYKDLSGMLDAYFNCMQV